MQTDPARHLTTAIQGGMFNRSIYVHRGLSHVWKYALHLFSLTNWWERPDTGVSSTLVLPAALSKTRLLNASRASRVRR